MSSSDQSQAKKNQGRRRVNITKIEKESNLQVTFSKRRAGLFKKTSELCTLTGAEAAVVVFSPGNKAHSFGNPDFNSVADRFLTLDSPQTGYVQQSLNPTNQQELEYLAHLESMIEAEKARGEELDRIRRACGKEKWIPPEELDYQQLDCLKWAVKDLGKNLETRVEKCMDPIIQYNPSVVGPLPGFDTGSSDGTIVRYGEGHSSTVIPYDHGANGSGEAENMTNQFNTGYGRWPF